MGDRFRDHVQWQPARTRFVLAGCWALLLAIGIATSLIPVSTDPLAVHAVGILIAAASAYFLVRSFRWATIDLDGRAVVVRGIWRTKRLELEEIDRFLAVRGDGGSAGPTAALAVRTRTGRTVVFDDIWGGPGARGLTVERLSEELNRALSSHRPAPSARGAA